MQFYSAIKLNCMLCQWHIVRLWSVFEEKDFACRLSLHWHYIMSCSLHTHLYISKHQFAANHSMLLMFGSCWHFDSTCHAISLSTINIQTIDPFTIEIIQFLTYSNQNEWLKRFVSMKIHRNVLSNFTIHFYRMLIVETLFSIHRRFIQRLSWTKRQRAWELLIRKWWRWMWCSLGLHQTNNRQIEISIGLYSTVF